jgi:hypothetical protein
MTPIETKFREVEKQLDSALQSATHVLQTFAISLHDTSVRSYQYKEAYLSWSYLFKRVWELDLETAQVQVRLSYPEPIEVTDPPQINVWLRAEKFRPGQESSQSEKSETTIPLSALLNEGIDAFVVTNVKAGGQTIGQAL